MRLVYTEFGTVEKPILERLYEFEWAYIPPESLDRDLNEALDISKLKQIVKIRVKVEDGVLSVINKREVF
jgi:hypothetical protein